MASFEPWGTKPVAPLAIDATGNLYGITAESGPDLTGGLVYQIAPDGTYTPLARLPAEAGAEARYGLTLGSDGNLYGTTSTGGANGFGTIFSVTPSGVVRKLSDFSTALGQGATSPLTLSANKNLYGLCGAGGAAKGGTVFGITPAGKVGKVADMTVAKGTYPSGSLAVGPDHALYGTALQNGPGGTGTIFRVGLDNSVRAVAALDSASSGGLTVGPDAALYGFVDGELLFRVPFQGKFGYSRLSENLTLSAPELISGPDGRLYGLAYDGITSSYSVYRVGNGSGLITACATLPADSDVDTSALSRLTKTPDGALCGVTSSTAGVVFRVAQVPGNGAPQTVDDVFAVAPGTQVLDVLANDTDPDGDRLTIVSATGATKGVLKILPDHTLTYSARPGFTGTDTFTYTAVDGFGGTSTATVTMTNTAPTAQDFTAYPHVAPLLIDALAHAADVDAQPLRLASLGAPAHGKAVLWAGKVVYTPGPDFTGHDAFTYTVTDGFGGDATATITLVDAMFGVSGAFSGSIRTADSFKDLVSVFHLALSRSGVFTASFPDGPGAITGRFDGDGNFTRTIHFGNDAWYLYLHLDPATGKISGEDYPTIAPDLAHVISGGAQSYSAAHPFARPGTYTFAIDPSELLPNRDQDTYHFGFGFGVAVVTPAGSVRIWGRFCDGTPFSAGSAIYEDHSCIFHASLSYGVYEPGSLTADFHFKDDGKNDLYGDISFWRDIQRLFLPNGFLAPLSPFPPGYFGLLKVIGSGVNPQAPLLAAPSGSPNTMVEFSNNYFGADPVDRFVTFGS